ncbi:MAG TPA: tail fiber domain-containing protein, partial [Chloroflexota bacterium]|nr:tail fiber domain-containing protein [Chloroflexota bacterium]
QNVNTEIHLRRSWDGSCDTICVEGYYYDWGGGTYKQILDVSVVQIGDNNASTFDVYVYVEGYSGLDFWEALHDSSSDYVWNNTVTSDPGTGSNIRNLQKTVSFQNGLLNINKDLGTVSVGGDLTVNNTIKPASGSLEVKGGNWGMNFSIDTDANSADDYDWYSDNIGIMNLDGDTGNLQIDGELTVSGGNSTEWNTAYSNMNMLKSGAYYTQLVSSNELNLYNNGDPAKLYINHNTNSNANSDVDISHGTLTVYGTGGINVDGGIRNNGIFESTQSVYNTGTSEWTNIGTWSNAQGGETLVLRYYGGRGYNNNLSQNVNTEIHLRRSWDGSCDAICVEGYYYDWGGGTDEQILDVSVVQIGDNNASTFDVYVYVNAYSGIDFWEALHDSSSDFVWNNTVTSDPETGSNIRNLQKTVSFQNGLLNINKDLGTVSVGGDLTTSGNITAPGFFYSSDKQLKKDIRKINNPLDKIMQLEGVSFKWQEDNEESLGLIAQ